MRQTNLPDLSIQHRAAEGYGKMIAQGIISQGEAVSALIVAARQAGSQRPQRDLESEFVWSIAASVADWSTWRGLALHHLRKAVELIPSLTIKQAAAINAEYGEPLLVGELRAWIIPEGDQS